MTRKKVLLLLLIIISGFAVYMELGFRARMYRKFSTDSILAGTMPNFIAVLLLTMIYINLKDGKKGASRMNCAAMATTAMVVYELAQPLIPGRVFDVNDILASLLGGLFIYGVLTLVDYYYKPYPTPK